MVCVNIFWVNGPTGHQKLKLMLDDKTAVLQFKKRVLLTIMEKVKLNTDRITDENIEAEIAVIIFDGSYLTKNEDYLTLGDLCREDTLNVIASTRHFGLVSIYLVYKDLDNPKTRHRCGPVPAIHAKFDLAQDTIATLKKHIIELGRTPRPSPYLTLRCGDSDLDDSDLPLGNILLDSDSFQNKISYYIKKPVFDLIEICVKGLTGKKTILKVGPYMLVQDLKLMVQEKEGIPPVQQRLIFRGLEMTNWDMLAEYGVKEESTVDMVLKLHGGGTGAARLPGISFADISDTRNMVERQFSRDGPSWRISHRGLNFEGICVNSICKAYKEQVISQWKLPSFHLRNDSAKVCCPICNVTLKSLLTCGFTSTFWKYYGRKFESVSELISHDWQEAKDSYTTFNVNKSGGGLQGMANWNLLVIQTRARLVDKRGSFHSPTHCGICFKPLNCWDSGIRRMSCDHVYHQNCIESADFPCVMCPDPEA